MSGLYVHIPFCARVCPYCDFAVQAGASETFVERYLEALRLELCSTLRGENISTIFLGGGTPTALDAAQLKALLATIRSVANLETNAEISIEANPENLDEEKLAAMRDAGFNRLSMGAQSFDDAALRQLGRRHDGGKIETAFANARRAGFDNISLDLIYAVPQQSRASWRDTLRRAIALEPEHISCYSLTIEEGTPFSRRIKRGRMTPVEDDEQAELMDDAQTILSEAGVSRYEISNYARPGFECRHNLNYWRGGDYLACGCGAHGHRAGHRWWNERSSAIYVEKMEECNSARAGEEFLTAAQRLNEQVLLGLRLREGFDLEAVSRGAGLDAWRILGRELRALTSEGVLRREGETVFLAPHWTPLADAVAARLLRECS